MFCMYTNREKNEIDWKKRSDLLDELINIYKGKYDYDCIVPFSGGKTRLLHFGT